MAPDILCVPPLRISLPALIIPDLGPNIAMFSVFSRFGLFRGLFSRALVMVTARFTTLYIRQRDINPHSAKTSHNDLNQLVLDSRWYLRAISIQGKFSMRAIIMAILATVMVVSNAFAWTNISYPSPADVSAGISTVGPLAPGKPAGVKQAQIENVEKTLLVVGFFAIGVSLFTLMSRTQGFSGSTTGTSR